MCFRSATRWCKRAANVPQTCRKCAERRHRYAMCSKRAVNVISSLHGKQYYAHRPWSQDFTVHSSEASRNVENHKGMARSRNPENWYVCCGCKAIMFVGDWVLNPHVFHQRGSNMRGLFNYHIQKNVWTCALSVLSCTHKTNYNLTKCFHLDMAVENSLWTYDVALSKKQQKGFILFFMWSWGFSIRAHGNLERHDF